MTPSTSWLASLLLATPLLVSAVPSPQASTAGCTPLSAEQVQTIPGWTNLKSTAEKDWGTSPYNIITNDPNYTDQPATDCAGTAKGWVWFEYLQTIQGHYKWALNMESVLPSDADRKIGVNPAPAPTTVTGPPASPTPATPARDVIDID
ncbi:hypothetical protein B0H10DRAFT_2442683 [Mycena sp. CBHHK59/15]|nr:hypothetical protein B0H10DRAFT_2442683 [Mycena sp. CBHHK59/15]